MNLPLGWLGDYTDVSDIDIKEYCDRMTDTGSKTEGYEILAEDISNVLAGRIANVEPHPDADRLVVCSVNVGKDGPIQIVTAAKNVKAGDLVPVAVAPAKLPGGVEIKAGKLRGILSEGMFCSIAELGLTLHDMPYAIEDGILILSDDPTLPEINPGDDVCEKLGLRERVVEFEITPNRPDCLSVIGLARETSATFGRKLTLPENVTSGVANPHSDDTLAENIADGIGKAAGKIASAASSVFKSEEKKAEDEQAKAKEKEIYEYLRSVKVENAELCPRYTAKVVKNVKIAPSPLWMRMRLRAAGVRPINNIVDITNYVMIEYGQPMHAFDYSCLRGGEITVREAFEGENFRSLDDIDHELKKGMLVISDNEGAVALAGVMGGANSEIKDDTATVVFESANFMGSSVRITSRALGMRTESSGRFEKGLDPENTVPALARACELVELLGAGEIVGGQIDVYAQPWKQTVLPLEVERINHFLGVDLDGSFMKNALRSLGFGVDMGSVRVPSFRGDVGCMADLAEEVIRIYGYNKIPATDFRAGVRPGRYTPRAEYKLRLASLLIAEGLYETYTFSFVSPKLCEKIAMSADDPRRKNVVIRNPLGEDTSVMRTTLLPSVLDCLARNNNYHGESCGLFETSPVYLPQEVSPENPSGQPKEPLRTVIAFYDSASDKSGKGFYELKGIIENILSDAGVTDAYITPVSDDPTFHPGRCAAYMYGGEKLITFGQLHPTVSDNYGFSAPVYAADIDTEKLASIARLEHSYTPLPKFPATSRDFAFLCDESITVGQVETVLREAGGELLRDVALFDIYRGANLGEGKKSLAFTVSLRADDRTLTDDEADKVAAELVAAADEKLGITQR